MGNRDESLIQTVSESGIAAVHPHGEALPALVGPSTEVQLNTIEPHLAPLACWSIGDARFEFGSSFILPEIADDVKSLAALVAGLENKLGSRPLASVFGHADPVGKQALNKKLSGRRAAALYALLTRRPDIWEDLFSDKGQFASPLAGDKWGGGVIRTILADLGYTAAAEQSDEAVKKFQSEHGLAVDGDAGPKTREALFRTYMEKHCKTRDGEPFQLDAKEFLGRGEDAAGKGDYQGCSEFNPLLVFSEKDASDYSKSKMKSARDEANRPNRRVLVYLFHPEDYLRPAAWPCPRAKEGYNGCTKRFWSDADRRRANAAEQREYQETKDTFSCRFYQRLAERSPCELTSVQGFVVYLLDPNRQRLSGALWRVRQGDALLAEGTASDEALAVVSLAEVPETVTLEWRPAGGDESAPFPYARELFPRAGVAQTADNLRQMLTNLGYDQHQDESDNVKEFQADFGLERTGLLEDICDLLQSWHDTGEAPPAQGEEVVPEDCAAAGEELCGEDE